MASTPLGKKLRLAEGQRVLLLDAPPEYLEALDELPEGVTVSTVPEDTYDFVHAFVKTVETLERLAPVMAQAVTYDGVLWVSYPKKSAKVETDITRDTGWEVMGTLGLRPVTQVAIDEVWSALRFRPIELVGKK